MLIKVYHKKSTVGPYAHIYVLVETDYKAKHLRSANINPKMKIGIDQWLETVHRFGPWIKNDQDPELALYQNDNLLRICDALDKAYLQAKKRLNKEPTARDIVKQYERGSGSVARISIIEFIDDYIKMKDLTGQSARNYTEKLGGALRKYIAKNGDVYMDSVDTTFMYKFEMYMKKAISRHGKPYNVSTVRAYMEWLRSLVGLGQNLGEVQDNVKDKHSIVTPIRKRNKAKNSIPDLNNVSYWPIPIEDLHRIETVQVSSHHTRGDSHEDSAHSRTYDLVRTRLLFLLQTWTGLSYSDLCVMQNAKMNIKIEYTGVKSLYYYRQKGGELAMVKLFPPAEDILRALEYDCRPLMTYDDYLTRIKALMRFYALELPADWGDGGTHLGRHLFGLRMLHRGFSMESVSRMMGHSTIKYTETVYARVDMTKINADYERILRAENGMEDVKIAI